MSLDDLNCPAKQSLQSGMDATFKMTSNNNNNNNNNPLIIVLQLSCQAVSFMCVQNDSKCCDLFHIISGLSKVILMVSVFWYLEDVSCNTVAGSFHTISHFLSHSSLAALFCSIFPCLIPYPWFACWVGILVLDMVHFFINIAKWMHQLAQESIAV